MTETRLDRLIEYAERAKRYRRLAIPKQKLSVAVAIAGTWLVFVLSLKFQWPIIGSISFAIFAAVLLWTGWFGLQMLRWEDRYRTLLESFDIPIWMNLRGHNLYGYGYDSEISIAECYECHIPGDCPICGAE